MLKIFCAKIFFPRRTVRCVEKALSFGDESGRSLVPFMGNLGVYSAVSLCEGLFH